MIGCGGVGLQVIAAHASRAPTRSIAVDRDAAKLELARRRGATHVVDSESRKPVGQVARADRRRCRPRVRGRRPAGDDAARLGRDPARRDGGRRRARARGGRGLAPGDRVPLGQGDPGLVLRLGRPGGRPARRSRRSLSTDELDLAGVVTNVAVLDGVNDALDRLRHGAGARSILVLDESAAGISARPA